MQSKEEMVTQTGAAGSESTGVESSLSSGWELLMAKLNGWLDAMILSLPNLLIAILFMVIVVILSRYFRKVVRRFISKFSEQKAVNDLVATVSSVVLIALGFMVALSIMDLDQAFTSILAGAGVVGLIVGLAFQDAISNLLAGVILAVRKQYGIGDHVETNGYEGKISKISMRNLQLETFSGQVVVIPNKMVVENPLVNYSVTGVRRIELDCGVSYAEDLDKVESVALEAIKNNVDYLKERDVDFFFTEFGDSSINLKIRFWLDGFSNKNVLNLRSDAIRAVKSAFDKHDILIPFPIRTLDFAIKGGDPLKGQLKPLVAESAS